VPFWLDYFASISGIISGHRPTTKGDFIDMPSMDCHHANLIPLLWSCSFNSLVHIFLKISILTHC